jgi:hypothetical protein
VRLRKVSASSLVEYSEMAICVATSISWRKAVWTVCIIVKGKIHVLAGKMIPGHPTQSETLGNEPAGLPVVIVVAVITEFNSIHVY